MATMLIEILDINCVLIASTSHLRPHHTRNTYHR